MKAFIISLIDSFLWRVRGGWRIPYTDKKVFLNKIWFAIAFGIEAGILKGWDWALVITTMIATLFSYQSYGWGEYIGCLLCGSKPYPERSDCDLVDDIVDSLRITINARDIKIWKFTLHIPQINWKLSDHPVAWGWLGLSLRGLLLTFFIGLALNSIWFMPTGFAMGTIYWLAGKFNKLIDDGKCGWKWAEWFFGAYLGLMLYLLG